MANEMSAKVLSETSRKVPFASSSSSSSYMDPFCNGRNCSSLLVALRMEALH